jgi:hypothetical protein
MRKGILLILILFFLVNPGEIRSQNADQNQSLSGSEIPTALSMLFNRVLVYLREGGALSGLLVGVKNDNLILRISGRDEEIPLDNLARVTIETERKRTHYGAYGMLLGAYLGNLISFRAKNQPTAYMQDMEDATLGLVLWNLIFASAGGGLGYLASSIFEKGEKVFDFTGNGKERQSEWEKLKRFIIGFALPSKKVHLTVQAGYVFTRVSSQYKNIFKNAGYYVSSYSYLFEEHAEEANDFNFLRKFQLTISPISTAEIGFAIYWLGEPSTQGDKWPTGFRASVAQSLHTIGYYAIAIYKPFLKQMPNSIVWNAGIGVGAAKVNFSLKSYLDFWEPYFEERSEHNISKYSFSSVIFTELNLYLHESMSLGFTADYAFIPSEQVPEILSAGIPAQEIRLGNGNIGFTLGLHF